MRKRLQKWFVRITGQDVPEFGVICEGGGRVGIGRENVDRYLAQPHVQAQLQAVRNMSASGEFALFC
jgi:hypothetical protein